MHPCAGQGCLPVTTGASRVYQRLLGRILRVHAHMTSSACDAQLRMSPNAQAAEAGACVKRCGGAQGTAQPAVRFTGQGMRCKHTCRATWFTDTHRWVSRQLQHRAWVGRGMCMGCSWPPAAGQMLVVSACAVRVIVTWLHRGGHSPWRMLETPWCTRTPRGAPQAGTREAGSHCPPACTPPPRVAAASGRCGRCGSGARLPPAQPAKPS
jgi:hypothetical protein